MSSRDYGAEIAAHEAAIRTIERERRAERAGRVGIMPPVRSPQETGAMGGRAFIAKYGAGAMPRGGRRRNLTLAEIQAITRDSERVSARPRPGRQASRGVPMG